MRLAYPDFHKAIRDGRGIVTPNRRLAAVAHHEFAVAQLEGSRESWHRPAIHSLDAWLVTVWHEARHSHSSTPALLSRSQEQLLWRNLIQEDVPGLFDVESTARMAVSANRAAIEWRIPDSHESWHDHSDAQQFLRWRAAVRKTCRDNGWITRADLLSLVSGWISSGLCRPNRMALAGFDEVTSPALRELLDTLGASATILKQQYSARKIQCRARELADLPTEIEEAARRARSLCEAASETSVGVLVPALQENQDFVRRIFRDVFQPSSGLALVTSKEPGEERRPPFQIHSSGSALERPVIAAALLILELTNHRLEISAAGALLRSAFIKGAQPERSERALADLELRRLREIDVSLRDLENVSRSCPQLKLSWARVHTVLRNKRGALPLANWSELFGDLLGALGWPGDVELSSGEQEDFELWKTALSELAALDFVSRAVTVGQAFVHLKRLLSEGASEREDLFAPVQILDLGSSEGLQFDQIIITGGSEEHWPPRSRTPAFLPPRLQRTYGLPGGQPERSQEDQRHRTELLLHSGRKCFVTYSGRLSPLIATSVRSADATGRWVGNTPRESYSPAALEELIDQMAPPFRAEQAPRGGTSILKLQSLCPFRAFAEIRLRAQSPEDACFGFDSRDRGGFLHRALQIVWQQLETSDRLWKTSDSALREIVRQAALLAVEKDENSPFHELISMAERERLENLVFDWLQLEKGRKQPFTVRTIEQEQWLDIAGMRLRLRLDRVDELKDGRLVLIDYKSGKQTASKLEGERPAEPQLLVYATAIGPQVDGIFFGQIKARELRAVGFSRTRHFDGRSATIKKDWDDYLECGRESVERLAAGFVEGQAAVDPIKGACDFCVQKPFCRVKEQLNSADEDDEFSN